MGTNYNVSDVGTVRAGTTTNNVTSSTTGITFAGTAIQTRYVSIPAAALPEGNSKPPIININSNWEALDFSNGKDISLAWTLPNDYNEGTDLTFEVYYQQQNTEAGVTLFWTADYQIGSPSSLNTLAVPSLAAASGGVAFTAGIMYKSAPITLVGAGKLRGDLLNLKITRDGASTAAGRSRVLAYRIGYQINRVS